MRLLLLNQFYPPDVAPTGVVLHDVARELARRGHDVTAVCSRRSYDGGADYPPEQTLDGVRILRLAAGVRDAAPLKLLTRREFKGARLVLALGPHMARRARAGFSKRGSAESRG